MTAAVPAPGLPPRRRQPVGALDTVHVPPLKRRVDAVGGIAQGRGDPAAPAHPRAGRERLAEKFGCAEAAADSSRDPAVGIVEGRRPADQVEHGVLDGGPRQMPRRLPFRNQPPRSVDNHPPDPRVSPWVLLLRHAYVNSLARLVGEVLNLGGGFIAEHCARPHPEHCGPQSRLPRQVSGEGRIDPAMQPLPRARVQPPLDGLLGQARVKRLLSRDDACLVLKLAEPGQVWKLFHAPSLNRPASPPLFRLSICG